MREYDYNPRPAIENHYHVRELIDAQEKRSSDRTDYHERVKKLYEREDEIVKAEIKKTLPFHCGICHEDFVGEAIKQVENDWTTPSKNVAFYKTKCFKGHWTMRMITDKIKDSYFAKSRNVAADRGKYFAEMIQPFETNYELLYSKKRS